MPRIKLTKTAVDALPYPDKGQILYHDTEVAGFGICIGRSAKTYFAQRDIHGKTVRTTIGKHGVFTAEQARKQAKELLVRMAQGENPNATKRESQVQGITLQDVYQEYMQTRKGLSAKTAKDYGRVMALSFSDWLDLPVVQISKDGVAARHSELGKDHGEAWANLSMRVLRALLNFAASRYEELNLINPVSRLSQTRAWYKVGRRQSYIKPHQLPAWYQAVMSLDSPDARDYLRLVLFSGLRLSEAASLRWENIDFSDRTLTVPQTKNGQPLTLPLSDFLQALLAERRKTIESPYVFPGPGAKGHLVEPKKWVAKAAAQSQVDFTLHDLRRTFITVAESLDIPAYALKRLVNHKMSSDVTAGYIIMSVDRLRQPMQRITDHLRTTAQAAGGDLPAGSSASLSAPGDSGI